MSRRPGGQVYKFAYNAVGWLTTRYDAYDTTKALTFRYDTAGRQTSLTNRRGQQIAMTYDALDRLLTRTANGTMTDSLSYTPTGLIAQLVRRNGGGAVVSRDSLYVRTNGLTDSLVHGLAGYRYALTYTYSSPGMANYRWFWLHTNSGINFDYGFVAAHDSAPALDSMFINSQYAMLLRNADGLPDSLKYPLAGPRVQSLYTAQHQLYSRSLPTPGSQTLQDSLARTYTYDSLGRVIADHRQLLNGRLGARSFVYDSLGQLLKVVAAVDSNCTSVLDTLAVGYTYSCSAILSSVTQDSATYDSAGNRLFPGASYSARGNHLTAGPSGVTYTYDADGNLATRGHGGVTDFFYWSPTNQLDSVVSGTLHHWYEYNTTGQLVRRQTKVGSGSYSVDRYFLWDGNQLIAELTGTGTGLIGQYTYYGGTDQPFALETDTAGAPSAFVARYFYQDPVEGNLTGLMRDSLTLHQYTQYGAWGQQLARPINQLADTNRLGWKGLLYEGDSTRLYYVRNRWYDPAVGRFISEDPIGIAGGPNLYTYAGNDPINGTDPTGLDPDCDPYADLTCAQPVEGPTTTAPAGGSGLEIPASQMCMVLGVGCGGDNPYWEFQPLPSFPAGGTGSGYSSPPPVKKQPAPKPKPKTAPPPIWRTFLESPCTGAGAGLAITIAGDALFATGVEEVVDIVKAGLVAKGTGVRAAYQAGRSLALGTGRYAEAKAIGVVGEYSSGYQYSLSSDNVSLLSFVPGLDLIPAVKDVLGACH